MTIIDSILQRRSMKLVQEPGPSAEQLDVLLRSAMCAPDHGRLRPWRFKLIRGADIVALGEQVISVYEAAGTPLTEQKAAATRAWLAKVPLLIAVACHLDHSNDKIPEEERLLACGAAVSNILNVAHAQGFGAFWSTGLGTYTDEIPELLGFDALDYRFMGFVSIGTPIHKLGAPERPDPAEFVQDWHAA